MSSRIRKALVLGAGLGSRLQPLTTLLPKPLLPIFGKELITFPCDHLLHAGVAELTVNVHHLATTFQRFFSAGRYRERPIRLSIEPDRLETGGAIRQLLDWIGQDPLLVYSGDIIADFDLGQLVDAHQQAGNAITLALRHTGLAQAVTYDPPSRAVIDVGRAVRGHAPTHDFANVSVWSASAVAAIPGGTKISIAAVLLDALRSGRRIGGVILEEGSWFNIGSRRDYFELHRWISAKRWRPLYGSPEGWPVRVSETADVSPSARLEGNSWVGAGATVEDGAWLRDTMVWPDTRVRGGSVLTNCLVARGQAGPGEFSEADFL